MCEVSVVNQELPQVKYGVFLGVIVGRLADVNLFPQYHQSTFDERIRRTANHKPCLSHGSTPPPGLVIGNVALRTTCTH
jgi:hypothetical protein